MGEPRYPLRPADPMAARELGRALGVSSSLAQVLLHRGLSSVEAARDWVDPRLSGLTPPDAMADRGIAADRIARAIRASERIAIFGDYDVDGTTSTAILAGIIEALGGEVAPLCANRFEGGYGLSDPGIDKVLATQATLLITCDCGSSDHERIERANRAGLDVIVVDHHLVPREKLPAMAFLNPHRPECGFAYKGLASAGLALSIGAALRAEMKSSLDLRPFLDLVALGTVADVAPLDGDNRRLVRAGLARLSALEARPGVAALREVAKIKAGNPVGAMDIAFRLAPRLNAAGRLGDPAVTLALLRARSLDEARAVASTIEALNDDRKAITKRITDEAIDQVHKLYPKGTPAGLVVASSQWHRGVVGIVAARLVDLFDRPAVVIAVEGGVGHGSGRTPAGFPLYDAIKACADELDKFGGHQAAAGLSIQESKLGVLREGFVAACERIGRDLGVDARRSIDVVLDGDAFPVPPASELALVEPVGASNPEPLFAAIDAKVEDASAVGDGHLKLALRIGKVRLPCFGFDMAEHLENVGAQVSVCGGLRWDSWRGGECVEMRLQALL